MGANAMKGRSVAAAPSPDCSRDRARGVRRAKRCEGLRAVFGAADVRSEELQKQTARPCMNCTVALLGSGRAKRRRA